ncbi:TetR family transcriptional regulator [Prauserella shujinwangii]|uniref:TetR family transcriptional regulator n=1 Tax=Prauserella shujinwangii TaxID=1453103 RepID=A0A2T0LQ16_9PSEU|nr:TetR/AcrR family transcriptional regulator [Prauserella shujinwangii]PRX45447.1 TetR family transcriptional regulator [Prauserella shujinwangii]
MPRLTRAQQRERTRQRLLDATVACLVDHGYAGTTTQRIQDRAQVSRGALLHHFGAKDELFVAAIHHIADHQLDRLRAVAAAVEPGPRAVRGLVTELHAAMSGPLFLAGLELWMAARTDASLRQALLPAERRLGRALREVFAAVVPPGDQDDARLALESLLMILRGLALTSVLRDRADVAADVLDLWVRRALPAS